MNHSIYVKPQYCAKSFCYTSASEPINRNNYKYESENVFKFYKLCDACPRWLITYVVWFMCYLAIAERARTTGNSTDSFRSALLSSTESLLG